MRRYQYVNEIYADVFAGTYGFNTIGLRYFNVFGPRQDPNDAYADVIPMRATLQEIKAQLCERMHDAIPVQEGWLRPVVTGYFAYHAVPTNSRALGEFRYHVTDLWQRTLRRRSQKDGMTWERMTKIAAAWLPPPRILHPWPDRRFAVTHPRWEPNA